MANIFICPWLNWKFHRCSGVGEPGFEQDRVPAYPVKVQNGRVLVSLAAGGKHAERLSTHHTRCRARSSVQPDPCAYTELSRRRRWTPQTRASQAPTICLIMH